MFIVFLHRNVWNHNFCQNHGYFFFLAEQHFCGQLNFKLSREAFPLNVSECKGKGDSMELVSLAWLLGLDAGFQRKWGFKEVQELVSLAWRMMWNLGGSWSAPPAPTWIAISYGHWVAPECIYIYIYIYGFVHTLVMRGLALCHAKLQALISWQILGPNIDTVHEVCMYIFVYIYI